MLQDTLEINGYSFSYSVQDDTHILFDAYNGITFRGSTLQDAKDQVYNYYGFDGLCEYNRQTRHVAHIVFRVVTINPNYHVVIETFSNCRISENTVNPTVVNRMEITCDSQDKVDEYIDFWDRDEFPVVAILQVQESDKLQSAIIDEVVEVNIRKPQINLDMTNLANLFFVIGLMDAAFKHVCNGDQIKICDFGHITVETKIGYARIESDQYCIIQIHNKWANDLIDIISFADEAKRLALIAKNIKNYFFSYPETFITVSIDSLCPF